MSCTVCDNLYKTYKSHNQGTVGVKRLIRQYADEQKVAKLELIVHNEEPFFQARYQCNNCSTIWVLIYPDHAFPGSFEKESDLDN